MKHSMVVFRVAIVGLLLGAYLFPALAQVADGATVNGYKIIVPESSIPRPGRIHTNYFIVDTGTHTPGPPPGTETPGSLACVYNLVKGPKGCPIATSKNVPTGGSGAIASLGGGYYSTCNNDFHAFSIYFVISDVYFKIFDSSGHKPPVYSNWIVEEALDIEWAHAMAPKAKLFLVESKLCVSSRCNTDPTWQAVYVASKLVAANGGGVISMSWGDPEVSNEADYDKYFKMPGVVYFAASGDSGIGVGIYPGSSPYVVSVGGTYFNRDSNGNFTNEQYYTNGGGGDISMYEPRPSYQDIIKNIVGNKRGYPDVASDFCCAPIYLQGQWSAVGGTSWSSPTFAGIVNAAGEKKQSTKDELTAIYKEYANKKQYKADFRDITTGDPHCKTGWDLCAGVGSSRTYKGK
jgi:subtilase family serine protease